MSTETSRSNYMGKLFDVLLWVQARETPFTRFEMAYELGIGIRSTQRYLHCLEARDIVTSDRTHTMWTWIPSTIAEGA